MCRVCLLPCAPVTSVWSCGVFFENNNCEGDDYLASRFGWPSLQHNELWNNAILEHISTVVDLVWNHRRQRHGAPDAAADVAPAPTDLGGRPLAVCFARLRQAKGF